MNLGHIFNKEVQRDARNMNISANYWYRPHNTLVPISRLYVHFLLNSKLKYEFRSYFQQRGTLLHFY